MTITTLPENYTIKYMLKLNKINRNKIKWNYTYAKITSNLSLLAEADVTWLDVCDTFTNVKTSLNDMSRLHSTAQKTGVIQ